ncbi:MAG: diguanylate cyclase [Methylophaga sp.]|nr:diguanylate cyclase [Methylophaga sp.]
MIFVSSLQAEPIPISRVSDGAIGDYAEIFFEPAEQMAVEEARSLFADNAAVSGKRDTLNFGIGAPAHWLKFVVNNPTDLTITKVLSVETAWLDELAIYIFKEDELQAKYALGDSLVQTDRPIDNRFYVVEYDFQPGKTSLYLRVASSDAMILPIYLDDRATFNKRFEFKDYSYGLFYGVLAVLLLYNLVLFINVHSATHFFYSLFLASLIACNLAYTGHGFRWLWPDAVHWQQWANPVLMIVAGISGLVFATSFLKTRKNSPRLYWAVWGLCLAILISLSAAYYAAQIQTALILALIFVVLFTLLMAVMGILAHRAGYPSSKFFLPATVVAAISAMITALTVANLVPYSTWGYRAVEIGMLIESILLALALADNFRRGEKDRLHEKQRASTDPLTGLDNRRAFHAQVKQLWKKCQRQKKPMSVVIVDLDNFKQINEMYGHDTGDKVLEATAKQLQESLRNGNVLARWGDEEFIFFMPDTTVEAALHVAERIRQQIETICQVFDDEPPLALSASLGVADSRNGSSTLDELIREADKCLYNAKRMGKNRVATVAVTAV